MQWQKSTNSPSQPPPLSLSLSLTTTPNRKARLLRRARYGASPGDRYVTPPKTPWHNYTSVALKGGEEGAGGVGGGRRGVPSESEWGVEGVQRGWWCCWMLYSWLIQRDSPRDASRSSNKALLFLFFCLFFLEYCWVRSSQILWAPVFPLSHLRMPQKLFLADIGPVSVLMFEWIIQCGCGHTKGYSGSEAGWWFNVRELLDSS